MCLSMDEWNPHDIDYQHDSECHTVVHGWDEEIEAQDVWVSGLLPLECPYDIGDGPREDYDRDLMKKCQKAADILFNPFKHEPHG